MEAEQPILVVSIPPEFLTKSDGTRRAAKLGRERCSKTFTELFTIAFGSMDP